MTDPHAPYPPTREAGLGYTAPSNFHHWVGYASVAYLVPKSSDR